jgi:hypothetical protein
MRHEPSKRVYLPFNIQAEFNFQQHYRENLKPLKTYRYVCNALLQKLHVTRTMTRQFLSQIIMNDCHFDVLHFL